MFWSSLTLLFELRSSMLILHCFSIILQYILLCYLWNNYFRWTATQLLLLNLMHYYFNWKHINYSNSYCLVIYVDCHKINRGICKLVFKTAGRSLWLLHTLYNHLLVYQLPYNREFDQSINSILIAIARNNIYTL